jgi:uncharacterized integral membrane protein
MNGKTIVYIAAVVLVLVVLMRFVLDNAEMVNVNLLFWTIESSLAMVLVSTVVVTALIGIVAIMPMFGKHQVEVMAQKKRVSKLEKMLESEMLKSKELEATLPPNTITNSYNTDNIENVLPTADNT